jgi:hypothetical protein
MDTNLIPSLHEAVQIFSVPLRRKKKQENFSWSFFKTNLALC